MATAEAYLVHSAEQCDDPQNYCDVVWAESEERAIAIIARLRDNDDLDAYAETIAEAIARLTELQQLPKAEIHAGLRHIADSYGRERWRVRRGSHNEERTHA